MKLVASSKEFIDKNIKSYKEDTTPEFDETAVPESLMVRKTPTPLDLYIYSSSSYTFIKRTRK